MGEITNNMHKFEKECSCDEDGDLPSIFCGRWDYLPHNVLLQIFQYLCPRDLINAGLTCSSWLNVCYDDFLWKDFVYSHFQIDRSIRIFPGKQSWREEYKRLTYHIPIVETEVLKNHTDPVLHVSFAHNGKLFATCSKDASVLVWDSVYPAKIKYHKNMKLFSWKYTQFCQFNQSDTLLLVSGVHFGLPHTTSGEIAVFSLEDGFNLQCRVVNKPFDIFGTWYSDHYLLSGDFFKLGSQISASVLLLNKASQEIESEHVPIISELGKFCNINGNAVRTVMVANCLSYLSEKNPDKLIKSSDLSSPKDNNHSFNYFSNNSVREVSGFEYFLVEKSFMRWKNLREEIEYVSPIYYNEEYRKVEAESQVDCINSLDTNTTEDDSYEAALESEASDLDYECTEIDELSETNVEKLLIFTTGCKACTPHQIGFKLVKPGMFPEKMNPGPSLAERIAERERRNSKRPQSELSDEPHDPNDSSESDSEYFVEPDHLIDLNGHIIGMGLSPDHRYLYVNNRPWPEGCEIENPMYPPPIAQQIDIHVIDLVTLKEVGTMLRAHKAYTPNSECFSIFLNVSNEYVASGAEDRHGYLWDRHYGICLAKYPHSDVVNSVAFNPKDSEMLVTTSDDYTIKIWRSKQRVNQLNIENGESLPKGLEVRLRKKILKNCKDMKLNTVRSGVSI